MTARDGVLSTKSIDYLATVEQTMSSLSSEEIADRVTELVMEHEDWRGRQCLNLNAAETVISRKARRLLASDMATRVSEGFPGDKEYPASRQNIYIDEIEGILITLSKRLFGAKYIEWRHISTSMANASVFFALAKPGDTILSQSPDGGGNYSYNADGPPRIAQLNVVNIPCKNREYEIDVAATRVLAQSVRPRLIIVGGSNVLFPYPVAELRKIADEIDAILMYDAAHLGLLISAGLFQDPLSEGAHLVTMSTHKIMSGAVGALILTNEKKLAEDLLGITFPTFMQTRDQNKFAATAHAMSEMIAFGNEFASQIVTNAKALAKACEKEGFNVLGRDRDYTMTHQVFLELEQHNAKRFVDRCQEANILISETQHVGSGRQGVRLTVQEITRQGMKEEKMANLARFIKRAGIDCEDPKRLAADIEDFLCDFYELRFSFD